MNFSKAPAHPDEIFRLIARVPSGQEVLTSFLPLYRAQRVRLEPYEPALLARLTAVLGEGQPVGACFVNDGQTGSIHYDPRGALGVLAPFLVHEMTHALDTSLWIASKTRQTRRARNQLMLEAETRAFDLQHRFVEQLRKQDPAYAKFLLHEQARVRILHEKLTQRDIAELYGLEAA